MLKKYLFLFTAIAFLVACGPDSDTNIGDNTGDGSDTTSSDNTGTNEEDDGDYDKIIETFGNPVEMANLIKDVGVPYSKRYLADAGNIDKFDTDFKKALALGIFSADLGYLNIYEQNMVIVNYLDAINRLADDLNVGKHFNFTKLKNLAQSTDNIDSLLYHSVQSFNDMDMDLRTHGRSNLSTLVITGVWLEGLYLATQVYKETKDKTVGERIGEQQIVMNQLYPIIERYKNDPDFAMLLKEMDKLTPLYDQIEIEIIPGELVKKVVEIDGKPTVIYEQRERSEVRVTEDVLNSLIAKSEEVRANLLNY